MSNKVNKNVELDSLDLGKWKFRVPPKAFVHLQNSMRAMESANNGIPTIPLYGKKDVTIVDDYYKFAQEKGITYPQWQLEYELSRKSKFGEQGGRSPWKELKPDCDMYVTNLMHCDRPSIPETADKYSKLGLKLIPLSSVLNNQKREDKILAKAAGWPLFNMKKDDSLAQDIALHLARNGEWKSGYGYFFSYIRKQKNRIFVPAPFCVNLLQAQYHDTLLSAIQDSILQFRHNSPFRFFADKIGFYNLWPIMDELSKGLKPDHILYVVRDFFHMDTTNGEEQKIKHYCNKIAQAYQLKGEAYDRMEEIICFSNRMPIASPDGMIVNKLKGEASGATVTNQGESFCNEDFDYDLNKLILSRCAHNNIMISRIDSYGNGDDGISRYYLEDLSAFNQVKDIIDQCADEVCQSYGYLKNDKWKITLGTYGIYCQYEIYQEDGHTHADYPVSLALNAGMHPMHEIPKKLWDSDYYDWRWTEILTHLYGRKDFTIAIDFVDNGLKRGLFGKTAQDFRRIFSKYEKYRALQDAEAKYNEVNPKWTDHPELNPVILYIAKKRGLELLKLR